MNDAGGQTDRAFRSPLLPIGNRVGVGQAVPREENLAPADEKPDHAPEELEHVRVAHVDDVRPDEQPEVTQQPPSRA